MAQSIAQHDAGWSHIFQSDLDRIDQYSACGCEVVVTDPIEDVPAMRQDLESTGTHCGNGYATSTAMT